VRIIEIGHILMCVGTSSCAGLGFKPEADQSRAILTRPGQEWASKWHWGWAEPGLQPKYRYLVAHHNKTYFLAQFI